MLEVEDALDGVFLDRFFFLGVLLDVAVADAVADAVVDVVFAAAAEPTDVVPSSLACDNAPAVMLSVFS